MDTTDEGGGGGRELTPELRGGGGAELTAGAEDAGRAELMGGLDEDCPKTEPTRAAATMKALVCMFASSDCCVCVCVYFVASVRNERLDEETKTRVREERSCFYVCRCGHVYLDRNKLKTVINPKTSKTCLCVQS